MPQRHRSDEQSSFFNKKGAKIDLCEKHHEEAIIQHV
jgi:hypothetical protein